MQPEYACGRKLRGDLKGQTQGSLALGIPQRAIVSKDFPSEALTLVRMKDGKVLSVTDKKLSVKKIGQNRGRWPPLRAKE